MRIVVTFLATFSLAIITGAAFAMEPGTYRPGQPYHSSKSDSAYACSAQCQSDSQCRGWNFVTVKRDAKFGICEYNARRAAPVNSPVSISGDSIAANRTSTQLISGGSRTLRVGSQSTYEPRLSRAPIKRPVHALDTLPQRAAPKATQRPKAAQRSVATPRFQHSLESTQPINTRGTRPEQPRSEQPRFEQKRALAPRPLPRAVPQQTAPQQRPAYATQANQHPVTPARTEPQRLPMPKVAPRERVTTPVSTPTRNNLYGSLHDDVMAPKPLTPADIPEDTNAPIPTVTSVSTGKIMKDKLYGMAGSGR